MSGVHASEISSTRVRFTDWEFKRITGTVRGIHLLVSAVRLMYVCVCVSVCVRVRECVCVCVCVQLLK